MSSFGPSLLLGDYASIDYSDGKLNNISAVSLWPLKNTFM